jgi:hypothetical protein
LKEHFMSVDELAEELADFWFSAIAEASWEQRLRILDDIHAQLRADIQSKGEYEAVSPGFVAAIIERLGAPPVENDAQARIYAFSGKERHQDAARAWAHRADSANAVSGRDRRRFPRQMVHAISELWVQGRSIPCRLIDLSRGGARVVVREIRVPEPGAEVRLAIPDKGIRDAIVVFANDLDIGLRFAEEPLAA